MYFNPDGVSVNVGVLENKPLGVVAFINLEGGVYICTLITVNIIELNESLTAYSGSVDIDNIKNKRSLPRASSCLLYTSDAADD